MAVLVVILALVLLTAVIVVVAAPLRAAWRAPRVEDGADADAEDGELQELEARREAKYREIRDAELDFHTGKLSREDHDAIDAVLRSEALDILDRLERRRGERRAGGEGPEEGSTPRGA